MSVEQCAVCGVYGLPMKQVGLVTMCVDYNGCMKRKASRIDDDDNEYLAPLEGPDDPSVPHLTVNCSRGGCRMSFFINRDDPRLPDGPFLCADHDDTPTKLKMADHVEMILTCDRCGATLTAVGQSREAAREKLRVQIHEHRWLVVDRLEGAIDAAASLTGQASSMMLGAKDLCGECRKAL